MEFRLLGTLEVVDGLDLVDVGSTKVRALLALLLLQANRVVPTDRLVEDLWGGQPPPSATATLQGYVSALRRALAAHAGPGAQILVTRAPGYLIEVDPDDVDVSRFEALVAQGRQALGEQRWDAASAVLARALALFRGPALADFVYELFAQAPAARLDEARSAAFEDWVTAELALGHHAEIVGDLETACGASPLREHLRGQLMVALYRSGRQAEALRAYQDLRQSLGEELGIEPSAELARLEEAILLQNPDLDWVAPPQAPPPIRPPVARESTLVGRDQELATLRSWLADALGGRGRVAQLAGEPGIGKTSLAQEVVAEASAAGAEVVSGRCDEGEGAPAFWPWMQVMEGLLALGDAEALREALGPGAADLAQIVPEVKELLPDLDAPPSLDPANARFRLYDALTRFLVRLARRHPLVVLIDDLHWADGPSLQLLSFLAARIGDASILVLTTYRDVDPVVGGAMATTLAELARQPAAARLDVGGLGPPDVATFLAAATGSEPSEDLVTAVCDHTQGNPFFLSEMAQLLCSEDEGALSLPAAVPAGVRDVIRRRLSLLPPQTYNVLSLAAVVGQDFDLHVVARMEGLDDEQALEAIEPALAARVVLDSGEVGCYRFSHGLVRQTLYEELNSARRARLHRRVAEVLETVRSLEEGPGLVEVANHFWLAASTGVADKAIAYAGRAAQQALTRLAYEQAEEQLGRAFELVARLPAGVQRARQELDLQVRKCMLLTFTRGRASPAVGEACARGRELCREVDDPDQLVAALYRLGSYNSMRGVLPTQEELDEQMEAAERSGDPAVAVVAHRGSGAVHFYRGNLERAHDHLQRAFDGGNPLNDPRLITSFNVDPGVNYRFPLAMVVGALGDEAGARELSDAGIARARQLTDPYTLAFAICGASYVSTLLDDPTLAVELSQEGLEICRQRGFSLFGAWLSVFGGWALVATGEASEGFALLDRGLADCESAGARLLRPFYLGLFADALRREGRLQESISTLDEALEIAERSGERFYEAELHRLRGEVMAARWPDRRAEAEASIRRALAVAQAQKAALFARRAEVSLAKFTEVEPLGPAASEASSL